MSTEAAKPSAAATSMRVIGAWLRRAPFSATLMAASLAVHIVASGLLGRLPRDAAGRWGFQSTDLLDGHWWNVFTTVFMSTNTASMLLGVAVLGAVLGLAESTVGTIRTAVLFSVIQGGAVVLYTVVLGLGNWAGVDWPTGMGQATLLGPFAASAGTLMAASQAISLLWRRRLRVLVLAASIMLTMYVGHAQHLFILLAAVVGLFLGLALIKSVGPGMTGRSTSKEVRTILAIVVAVFAVGPFAAAVAHVAVGPLAVMRAWITNQDPTLAQWEGSCTANAAACHTMVHNLGLMGPGGHLLALMPMVLLLVCAEGLRRGNRLALWAAVYIHVVIGVVSAFYFQVFSGIGLPLRRGHRILSINESVGELLPVVLAPLLIATLLVVFRRHFRIDPDPVLRRRSLVFLPLLLVAFVALYAVAWLAGGNAQNPLGWAELVAGIPRIVLPFPFPFSYAANVYPHGFAAELLFSFGGPVLWALSAASILAVFLSRRQISGADRRDKALSLVRLGGDSLSWMAGWANNQYWFNAAGTAGVAYQIHNGVAVTVGGPVGLPEEQEAAVNGFVDFCTDESLTPCFYSVGEQTARCLEPHGWRRIAVAAETLLDVQTMDFKGRNWQNVRTAVNKAKKLGVTALWCSYEELTIGQRTQVNEISEDWVSGQALPELGFTLGGLAELKDNNVQLCLAIDEDGRIHAVTSWLPVFSNGEVVSWTLDFMRRNSGAFSGVMEYLIAQAVLHFAATVECISLSGSPLAAGAEAEGPLGKMLALLARTLEPLYGFSSLANFKQRFQPRHSTLYMVYQDPLSLPAMGRAIAEAYLPNISVHALAKLLRK
ncbi:DUF2156 domain-containing protein [Arthrobacter sp. E3]|uniref:phosphatidylglycerol lysyltransferase domain-containing protein n=1 Tax=Arthrobacter sp. E3 TaxID=517402 RepID=UPI001A94C2DC